MGNAKKIILLIALGAVAVGAVLALIALAAVGFDVGKLGTGKYATVNRPVEGEFSRVDISVRTADVQFVLAEDGVARVECLEDEKQPHTVAVSDGVLTVKGLDQRKWYEKISLFSKSAKVTVYLPEKAYAALSVKTDTGDVKIPDGFDFGEIRIETDTGDVSLTGGAPASLAVETDTGDVSLSSINPGAVRICVDTGKVVLTGVTCGDLFAETDTGKVKMTDVVCAALIIDTDTGDVVLTNVVGTGAATIKTDTGDVKLDRSDAASYTIRTDTGDVTGTVRTSKFFIAETKTGKKSVPQTRDGGDFDVSTHTGDIKISVAE